MLSQYYHNHRTSLSQKHIYWFKIANFSWYWIFMSHPHHHSIHINYCFIDNTSFNLKKSFHPYLDLNPRTLVWQPGFLTTAPPGLSYTYFGNCSDSIVIFFFKFDCHMWIGSDKSHETSSSTTSFNINWLVKCLRTKAFVPTSSQQLPNNNKFIG